MKKKSKLFLCLGTVCLATLFSAGLTACDNGKDDDGGTKHTHTYAESWTSDQNYHWHAATCEHTGEVSDKAEHTYENGVCTVCGYEETAAHVHSFEAVSAVPATCTEEGNIAYWYCEDCGKYFSDENGATEIAQADAVIPATGHAWSEVEYVWSADYSTCTAIRTCANGENHVETETVNASYDVTSAATCTTDGTGKYTVSFENSAFAEQTKEVTIPSLGHDYVEEVTLQPTCTETGVKTYTCSHDSSHTYTETIDATGHAWNKVVYVWSDDNTTCTATRTCANDENHVETETVNASYDVTSAATCTADGTGKYTVSFENSAFAEQTKEVTIPALGHEYVEEVTLQPTCTETGVKTYTCSHDSSHTYTETIDATGHAWNEVVYVWSDDNMTCTATRTCANDENHVETETVNASYDVTSAATCTADGTGKYTVSFENSVFTEQTKEVTIPATGHIYENGACTVCGSLQVYDLLIFTLSDDGTYYSITWNKIKDETQLAIPSTYNGLTVASIGYRAFYNCTSLTSITIPDSVTSIGNSAFEDCSSLMSITIPDGVTSIGDSVFYNCTSLTSVTIPDSVTSIGASVFLGCTSLTSVTIPDSVTSIGASVFLGCTSLTSVTVGAEVTSIGNSAFRDCYKLIEVYNKSSLTITTGSSQNGNISSYAKNVYTPSEGVSKLSMTDDGYIFYDDTANENGYYLMGYTGTETDLTLPENYNGSNYSIYPYAFSKCTSITSITISVGVTSIGSCAFSGCTSLSSIKIFNSVTSIGTFAFYNCTSLTSITIPDSVTSIGDYAFSGCTSLTSVTIPDRVMSIGDSAFYNCTLLMSITIPESVTSIGHHAFSGCTSLTEINYNATACADLSDNISVFSSAGTNGEGITVNIGANVKKIPAYLFYSDKNSPKILNVKFAEDSVCESIGDSAFSNTAYYNDESNWENGVLYIDKYLLQTKTSISGAYEIKSGTKIIAGSAFSGCTSLTSVTIPDSVTNIGTSAFSDCTSLTEINYDAIACAVASSYNGYVFSNAGTNGEGIAVNIGANVKIIPANLFYSNSVFPKIVNVKFAENSVCESIGSKAFYNCTLLMSITIPESVTSIGHHAFSGCTSLTEINYNATACADINNVMFNDAGTNGEGITVNIGANVKKIPAYLFKDSAILSVIFAEGSVCESIGSVAFYNCTSLTSITIPDEVTSIGNSVFYNCTSLTSVTIPDRVMSIGDSAFYNCTSLTSITIPDEVTSIGNSAFKNCTALISVTIGAGVTSIGEAAFSSCTLLSEINFNATECADLKYNSNVFSNAGQNGEGITVNIGANVKKIPAYLFYPYGYSSKIVSVVFAENSVCESIGNSAFSNCTSLTSVTIGNSVTSIGDYAFSGCTSLTSVTIGNSVTSIGYSAFSNCTLLTEINYNATECADLSDNISVFSGAGTNGEGITVNIGANVKKIPAYLFYSGMNSPKIVNVKFAENSVCESIGGRAFLSCASLTSVTFGNSVTSIGEAAFNNCTSLTSVTFENTEGWWVSTSSAATSGTAVDVSDSAQNVTYLTSTYCWYYWKRG